MWAEAGHRGGWCTATLGGGTRTEARHGGGQCAATEGGGAQVEAGRGGWQHTVTGGGGACAETSHGEGWLCAMCSGGGRQCGAGQQQRASGRGQGRHLWRGAVKHVVWSGHDQIRSGICFLIYDGNNSVVVNKVTW
jgi:hypothetical protein